ncbi:60S ribosomal protein l18a-like protein [Phtheirospermum japonicum]|uniref:60S ribosomal protein l18a-like protein n=1 Tax=Phtheirospermum japonicum TaxID=374723 RepID=A0A830CP64_9LAMI|nr:60S ribosomal protein l18a-like protein [Phtheirospermum japonicum]
MLRGGDWMVLRFITGHFGCNPLVHWSFSAVMCSFGLQREAWTHCMCYSSFASCTCCYSWCDKDDSCLVK